MNRTSSLVTLISKHIGLILILILASFLRFYQLGENPPAIYWDEVSLGYNAFSLLETGRDEYGNHLPFSIRSFNDYKPPLYSYLTIIPVWMFGLNEFAVRFVSATAGVVAVVSIYFLSRMLVEKKDWAETFALFNAFLLAVSPWHLHFSRAAFESNLAVTTSLIAVTCYLAWLRKKRYSDWFLLASVVFAASTMYAYHAARLVLPVIFLGLAIFDFKKLWARKVYVIPAIVLGLLLVFPLIYISSRGAISERFDTVSVFSMMSEGSRDGDRLARFRELREETTGPAQYLYSRKLSEFLVVSRNHLEHYNLDFLFLNGDGQARHRAYGMGLVYITLLPFMLFGLYKLLGAKMMNKKVVFIWLLAAPLASGLTADTPHAIRGLMLVVPIQWLTAWGLTEIYFRIIDRSLLVQRLVAGVLTLSFALNFATFMNLYYVISPHEYSKNWMYGYKELVSYLETVESDYEEIIVSNIYDQPHIYFAFYRQIDPREYQTFAETAHENIGQYYFRSIQIEQDLQVPNSLVVVEPDKTPDNSDIKHQIFFRNGEVAFNVIRSEE